MSLLSRQPIRRQIVALTGSMLLFYALVALWASARTVEERKIEVREQAASMAASSAAYLRQYLAGVDTMASLLARHPAVVAFDREGADALFAGVLRDQPLVLNVIVTDTAGVLKGAGLATRSVLAAAAAQPYIKAVVASGKPVVSDFMMGVVTGKPTIVLAYPVRAASDGLVGVLGIGIDLTQLQTVFTSIPLPDGSVITLTDSTSRVLARSHDAEHYVGRLVDPKASAPRDVPRSQERAGMDGVERVYGNAVIDRGPWLLSVGIPSSVAEARAAPIRQRNLGISFVIGVMTLALSLWGSKRISGGLGDLREAARHIAEGDLTPPVRTAVPNLELGQVQDAFVAMASNLREARGALDGQIEQERKMRETLGTLQRQVVRQERLAAVGVLVSGVAHELNNPLQAILGSAELLERRRDLSPEALEEVTMVKTQSTRAKDIIRNLSRFSSQHSGPQALVDLREVVAEVVQLRRRELDNTGIALEVETSSTRKVFATMTELQQVALNFVINAQQAIEADGRRKGRIRIRVYDAGKRVRLEVQDDGPGVEPADEPKLFQPFFTTKPVGKGTGLGLSISYGIIDSYGGAIGYVRNEWDGSTFFFELPSDEPRPPSPAPNRTTSQSDDRPPVLL